MSNCFNTFLVVLVSFTLIAHPTVQVAQAQSDSPPEALEEQTEEGESPTPESETAPESEGEEKEEGQEEEKEEDQRGTEEEVKEDLGAAISLKDAKGEDWLTLISALAAGYLAASIARNCSKKTLDASTVVAAGVAYLGSEIISTHKDKEVRDDIQEDYIEETSLEATSEEESEDTSADEALAADPEAAEEEKSAQIKSLKAQEESYNKLKETAEVKEGFQYAAAGMLAAASGIAIYQWTREKVQNRICNATLKKIPSALPGICFSDTTCPAPATTCQTALLAFQSELKAFNAKKDSISVNSDTKMAELNAFTKKTKAYFLKCEPHPKIKQIAKKAEIPCWSYLKLLHSHLMMCLPKNEKKGKGDAKKGGTDSVKEPDVKSAPKGESTSPQV